MNNFEIEDQILNSIDRDEEGNPINEVLFTVVTWQGRNFLYVGEDLQDKGRIAECVNGDYRKRYGDIKGWLKFIMKRTNKRLDNINDQINILQYERDELFDLKYKLEEVL